MSAPRSTTAAPRASRFAGRGALLVIAVAAIAVRGIAFARLPELTYDGTYYLRQAERLRSLHYDFIGFPPGYPIAVALVQTLVSEPVLAGRLASLVAGLMSLFLAWRLARRHLPDAWVLLVLAVLAVHPHLARVQVETLSESTYLALVLAAVLLFEARRDLVAGAALGAAYLVRPEALLLYAGFIAMRLVQDRRFPAALVLGLAPIAAYAVASSLAVGRPVLAPKQGQLDLGPHVLGRSAALLGCLHASFPIVLLPGVFVAGQRRRWALLLPAAPLLLLPLFAIHIQERLVTPALPFLLVLGVAWIVELDRRWQKPVWAVAALSFLVGAAPGFRNLVDSPVLTPHARAIGAALRPHLRAEDRVAGRFPFVAYYAGAGFVRAPREVAYDALIDSVLAAGATHLLVLEGEVRNVLPQLRPLFVDSRFAASDGRIEPAARVESPAGARALLYRLRPPPVPAGSAPVVRSGVESVDWLGTAAVVATREGLLLRIPGQPIPAPAAVSEPRVAAGGAALACLLGDPGAARLAVGDLATGEWSVLESTRDDEPASPAWIGGEVVYVRRRDPPGLRVIDPITQRRRRVALSGLRDEEAVPERVTTRGRDVAITYRRGSARHPLDRVLVTATWPEAAGGADVVLAGRWATELRLADPSLCWVPESDALLASLALVSSDDTPAAAGASLCVVLPDGLVRRLTYGLEAPRRPVFGSGRLAFLTGGGDLRFAPLAAADLGFEVPRVFALEPTPPSRK